MQGSNVDKRRSGKADAFHDEAGLLVRTGVHNVIGIHSLSVVSSGVKAVPC